VAALKGRRIVVIGISGSGKSTLARNLATRLGVKYVEIDALYWRPNWTGITTEQLREQVQRVVAEDAWVIDGNYSGVRPYIWARATTIIWLDYSLPVVMTRLIRRTTRRIVRREELWAGNRESIRKTLFSKKSILWWSFSHYKPNRQKYPALFAKSENAHLQILHFKSPRAADLWLNFINNN
jgi:adenylate kinase family enzyme